MDFVNGIVISVKSSKRSKALGWVMVQPRGKNGQRLICAIQTVGKLSIVYLRLKVVSGVILLIG